MNLRHEDLSGGRLRAELRKYQLCRVGGHLQLRQMWERMVQGENLGAQTILRGAPALKTENVPAIPNHSAIPPNAGLPSITTDTKLLNAPEFTTFHGVLLKGGMD